MSDLEQLLRDDFRKDAASLGSAAAGRLTAIDYRPRRRRRSPVALLGALGVTGAAATVFATIVALTSTAAPAFAGWTPTPSSPTPTRRLAATRACRLGTPVLAEARGPYTAAAYAVRNGAGACVLGRGVSLASKFQGGSVDEGSVAPGHIQLFLLGASNSSGHRLVLLVGRVGAGVTAVRFTRTNGVTVTSSVSRGWYLAWWPSSARATAVEIASGSRTRRTPLPRTVRAAQNTCGSGCGGSYYGGTV